MAFANPPTFTTSQVVTASVMNILSNDLKALGGGNGLEILRGSSTLDFPSIAASGGTQDLTITVTGCTTSHDVTVHWNPSGLNAGIVLTAGITANDTVTVRATNCTAGAINPAAVSVRVNVFLFH